MYKIWLQGRPHTTIYNDNIVMFLCPCYCLQRIFNFWNYPKGLCRRSQGRNTLNIVICVWNWSQFFFPLSMKMNASLWLRSFLFVVQCLDVVNIAAYTVQVLGRPVNDELGDASYEREWIIINNIGRCFLWKRWSMKNKIERCFLWKKVNNYLQYCW